jgi:hypothetical protein
MVGMAIKKGAGGTGGRSYQITAAILTYIAISMSSLPVGMHYAREREQAAWRALALHRSSGQPATPLTPAQMQAHEQDLAARQRALEEEFDQPHAERRPFQRSFPPPYLPSSPVSQPPTRSATQQALPLPVPEARVVQPRPQGVQPQILGTRVPQSTAMALTFWAFVGQFLRLTIASPFAFFWLKGLTLDTSLNFSLLVLGMVLAWRLTSGVEFVIFGPFDASSQASPLE